MSVRVTSMSSKDAVIPSVAIGMSDESHLVHSVEEVEQRRQASHRIRRITNSEFLFSVFLFSHQSPAFNFFVTQCYSCIIDYECAIHIFISVFLSKSILSFLLLCTVSMYKGVNVRAQVMRTMSDHVSMWCIVFLTMSVAYACIFLCQL